MKEKDVIKNTLHKKKYIIGIFILFGMVILLCIFKAESNMGRQPKGQICEKPACFDSGVLHEIGNAVIRDYEQDKEHYEQNADCPETAAGDEELPRDMVREELPQDMVGWLGKYEYAETFPHNSGEINYFIGIDITIYEEAGECYARITGDGWYLQTRTLARVTGDKDAVDITFLETLPGDSLYENNIQRYEPGEELLRFERLENGEINTEWKALRNQHPESFWVDKDEEVSGIYFEKMKAGEGEQDKAAMICEELREMDFTAKQPHMDITPEENLLYLEGYLKMLKGEVLTIDSWGKECSYKKLWKAGIEFDELLAKKDSEEYPYLYYYDDLDGDGKPEFAIEQEYMYIFKYELGEDKVRVLHSEEACYFEKMIGAGQIWRHNGQHENMVRDSLIVLNEQNVWESVLSLEQGISPDWDYHMVDIKEEIWVGIGEENWDELTAPFFEMAENNEISRMTLAEVFGELLEGGKYGFSG